MSCLLFGWKRRGRLIPKPGELTWNCPPRQSNPGLYTQEDEVACQNEPEPNTPWQDFNTGTFILFDVTAICFSQPSHYFPSKNVWSCFPRRVAEIVAICSLLLFWNLLYSVDSKVAVVYPPWGMHLFQIITEHYFKISRINGHSNIQGAVHSVTFFSPDFVWLREDAHVQDLFHRQSTININ